VERQASSITIGQFVGDHPPALAQPAKGDAVAASSPAAFSILLSTQLAEGRGTGLLVLLNGGKLSRAILPLAWADFGKDHGPPQAAAERQQPTTANSQFFFARGKIFRPLSRISALN